MLNNAFINRKIVKLSAINSRNSVKVTTKLNTSYQINERLVADIFSLIFNPLDLFKILCAGSNAICLKGAYF